MRPYLINIEQATLRNEDYRRVLFTGANAQLVLMTLQPRQDIGLETHDGHDQFIRVESGDGEVVLDGISHRIGDGSAIVIPAGVEHNVINSSSTLPMKLYSLYAPPEHADGTVHRTKADADAAHH